MCGWGIGVKWTSFKHRPSREEGKQQTDAKIARNGNKFHLRCWREGDTVATAALNFVAVAIPSSTAVQGCPLRGIALENGVAIIPDDFKRARLRSFMTKHVTQAGVSL